MTALLSCFPTLVEKDLRESFAGRPGTIESKGWLSGIQAAGWVEVSDHGFSIHAWGSTYDTNPFHNFGAVFSIADSYNVDCVTIVPPLPPGGGCGTSGGQRPEKCKIHATRIKGSVQSKTRYVFFVGSLGDAIGQLTIPSRSTLSTVRGWILACLLMLGVMEGTVRAGLVSAAPVFTKSYI